MSRRGRSQPEDKRKYLNTPIPITDDPAERAIVKWWERLSPDERLDVILATATQRPSKPKARLEYARCRIPLPDDPTQRSILEKFRQLKPSQRLAKLRTYKEAQ